MTNLKSLFTDNRLTSFKPTFQSILFLSFSELILFLQEFEQHKCEKIMIISGWTGILRKQAIRLHCTWRCTQGIYKLTRMLLECYGLVIVHLILHFSTYCAEYSVCRDGWRWRLTTHWLQSQTCPDLQGSDGWASLSGVCAFSTEQSWFYLSAQDQSTLPLSDVRWCHLQETKVKVVSFESTLVW